MADFIKTINTKDGPKPIDYNALANLPDLNGTIDMHNVSVDAHADLFATKADLGEDGKVAIDQLPEIELATTSSNGLMSFEDKTKLDACSTQQIIVHNSTSTLPPVVNGAILVAYDA